MSDRWERITALFDAARTLDAETRAAFLEFACQNDADLRRELDALLAADHPSDRFLATPAWKPIGSLLRDTVSPLKPGQTLKHRYTVEEQFGGGGQARVYRATDTALSRQVVVKVMRTACCAAPVLASRLDQEMQALARIDHPGIVGIHDVGALDDGSTFLVIQHIKGESLRGLLAKGPLSRNRASEILRQLGSALHAAHSAGISHRDLKPENIMIQSLDDGSELVKLIDFGLAKIERSAMNTETTTVMIAGTVRYMAPEQFDGHHSSASDVYALALIVCEMLTGHPDVRALSKQTRPRVRRLIESALAFKPEERPTDLTAWSSQLAAELTRSYSAARVAAAGAGGVVTLAVVAGIVAAMLLRAEPVRILQKVGAFDPVLEGFQIHNTLFGTVVPNADRTGYEGWRVTASRPGGYYFRKLTEAQKQLALDRGWTLSGEFSTEEGVGFAILDFAGHGKRFDIEVYSEEDVDRVLLQTQIVPSFRGLEFRLPGRPGAFHKYELRFDPSLQTASLLVDGITRLEGYRGHSQFQDDMGLFFGAGPYKVDRGVASFRSVRFEIHP